MLQFNRNCVRSTSSKGLLDILMSTLVLFCIATVISYWLDFCSASSIETKNTSRTNALQFPTRLFHISAFIATYFLSGGSFLLERKNQGKRRRGTSLNCILHFYRKILPILIKRVVSLEYFNMEVLRFFLKIFCYF